MSGSTRALTLLTVINLLNYIDRYVISALVESLKRSELGLSDVQAGLLMTGFILVYTVASPYFGFLGDRKSRPRVLAAAVALWSVATALGGLATGFLSLLLTRALVGIGEAAYITIAPTLLADYFKPSIRGRVFAVFFAATPIGSALGYMLGGLVDQSYGWRAAFMIAGAPGLLVAWMTLSLSDPPRGGLDVEAGESAASAATRAPGPVLPWRLFLGNKAYGFASLGYAMYSFGLGGLAFWLPAYLERVRGLSSANASTWSGAILVVTGFVGTFAGGWLGDWWLKHTHRAYLLVCAASSLLAVPCVWLAFTTGSMPVFWAALVLAELLFFASTGPINSAVVNLLPGANRAMGLAICNFITHILGDVPSPALIGWVSERSNLQTGVMLVPVALLLSGVLWYVAAKSQRSGPAETI
jgi:MFS family permease